jgi:hypothetical protein
MCLKWTRFLGYRHFNGRLDLFKPQLDLDDWQKREAKKIIDALEKHNITAMLIKDPEITAIALQSLLPNVTARLAELWRADEDDEEYEVEVVDDPF